MTVEFNITSKFHTSTGKSLQQMVQCFVLLWVINDSHDSVCSVLSDNRQQGSVKCTTCCHCWVETLDLQNVTFIEKGAMLSA